MRLSEKIPGGNRAIGVLCVLGVVLALMAIQSLPGRVIAAAAVVLLTVAVGVAAYIVLQVLLGPDNTLNSTVSLYGAQDSSEEAEQAALQRSRIIEQVVERAEEAAEARGTLYSTAALLEKAELPLRVGEAYAIQAAIAVVAFLVGFFAFGTSFVGAFALTIPAVSIPPGFVRFKAKRRLKKLEAQLPDALTLLASTLKAGYSFLQGIDAVAKEADEPLATEFQRTVNEARLGKPMDESLDNLSDRVGSDDMVWAVVAIKIQREVGGNLAELLTIVAETMKERRRLKGEVQALTAEGRISAYVLLALPPLIGLAIFFLNRAYISELWNNTLGLVLVALAVFSMGVGAAWMKKIVDIDL